MGRVAVELRGTAGQLRELPRSGMIAAAKAAKAIAAQEAARSGGRMTFARRGRSRTVTLKAKDRIIPGAAGTVRARIQGVPVGPWVWITSGTGGHVIGARARPGARGRSTRLARGRAGPARPGSGAKLRIGARWVSGPVWHRGSRGRGAWGRVATRIADVVPQIFDDELGRMLR